MLISNPAIRSSALVLGLLFAAAPATTQTPVDAPPQVLSAYDVKAGTVQDLVLPFSAGQAFQVRVVLDGVTRTLNLHPHDVRAKDFKLLVDDGTQLIEMPRSPSTTYQGTVAGFPDSVVAASLYEGKLTGVLDLQDNTWGIQPVRQQFPSVDASSHLVYRHADALEKDGRCGVPDNAAVKMIEGGPQAASAAIKEAEIAVDCDNAFYNSSRFGQGSVQLSQNAVNNIVNRCTTIYKRDVDVQFLVTTIIVRTSPVYSGSISNRLGQFQNRWRANHSNVRRDLAHLFSGIGGGGVIGVAYLGVVCSTASGYGASAVGFSGSITSQTGLVSHEAGHQFNAPHCSGGGCFIMCPSLGGCGRSVTKFGTGSINRIRPYAQSRPCLSTVSTNAPVLTGINPGSVTSWVPQTVQLTGTDLDSVTSVQVGSAVVTSFSSTATTLSFTPPSPFDITTHAVNVTNPIGTSNSVNLTVVGNHPSVLVAAANGVHNINTTADYVGHTDLNWAVLYFVAGQNGPSVIPGIVNWEIGNNFASGPTQIFSALADNRGETTLSILMPNGVPPFTFLYWQLVTYDPNNITFPLEVSNAQTVISF